MNLILFDKETSRSGENVHDSRELRREVNHTQVQTTLEKAGFGNLNAKIQITPNPIEGIKPAILH